MSPLKSPSNSTPRRVLGDLTPRALNTTPKQSTAREALEAVRVRSPLKQVQTVSPRIFIDQENASSIGALNAGKKGSISEVDGVENADRLEKMHVGRALGCLTAATHDMAEIVPMGFVCHVFCLTRLPHR